MRRLRNVRYVQMNDDYMMRKNTRLNVGRDGESERESEKESK